MRYASLSKDLRMIQLGLCIVTASGVLFDSTASADGTSEKPVAVRAMPNIPTGIPETEIPAVKKQAMEGSSEAAARLARFYGAKEDLKAQIFWLTIAVENGDLEQELHLARALRRDHTDPLSAIRARYWYGVIINHGSPELSALAKGELFAWEKYRKEHPYVPQK